MYTCGMDWQANKQLHARTFGGGHFFSRTCIRPQTCSPLVPRDWACFYKESDMIFVLAAAPLAAPLAIFLTSLASVNSQPCDESSPSPC